jgi:hypothetical protein
MAAASDPKPTVGLMLKLDATVHEALRQRAFDERRPMAELVREFIADGLRRPRRAAS